MLAALRPRDVREVRQAVRIAQRNGVALYPVSGGKNWGYGSRVPPQDGSVVLDLARLDRILEIDEELGFARIQPGVTQRALAARHRAAGRFWLDTTTSSAEASVLANALERGHGMTPYADHASTICGLEVVLPDGGLLRTGFGRFRGAACASLDAAGVGPSLDGLFAQGNFGVVTEASVWLLPAPERFEAAFFELEGDGALRRAVDALRPLRLTGTLRGGIQWGNEYRALQRRSAFPRDRRPPLAPKDARRIATGLGIAPWSGATGLYGTRAEVRAQAQALTRALRGIARKVSIVAPDRLRREDPRAAMVSFLSGGLDGPGLARCYWRKPSRPASAARMDPDRDRCGVIWCAPLVPFRGRDVLAAVLPIRRIALAHGFEPDVGIAAIRQRVLHFHVSLVYDRDVPGEDARALACHDEMLGALMSLGYVPHRLGLQSMHALARGDESYRRTVESLKAALDPRGILAPGRYEPPRRDR